MFKKVALAGLAILSLAAPAEAALVVRSFTFSIPLVGPGIPAQSGSFAFSYDDSDFSPTLTQIDYSINSTVFTTSNAGMRIDPNNSNNWQLGGLANGIGAVGGGKDDFLVGFSRGGIGQGWGYSDSTIGIVGFNGVTLTETTPGAGPVPEPATWAFMIVGFGAVGGAMRVARRKRPMLAAA